ncbi:hypothetical protein [Asticcacaulis endophyticus]|uniref:SMODS and SLOG-associating 2TM effector domain-containing protein n=1 Tax=Asticcacaulis endophyticus TaxID=1395890 RepID=A0A918UZM8_9CAUL|nr:hypothetical protein [Asticcacaulis endophyticus]GGZ45419.1 hypothetical protein GCM10011273_35160 [Asticcacaulis endophyticus]
MAGHPQIRTRYITAVGSGLVTTAHRFARDDNPHIVAVNGFYHLKDLIFTTADIAALRHWIEGEDWAAFEASHLTPSRQPEVRFAGLKMDGRSLDEIITLMSPYKLRMQRLKALGCNLGYDRGPEPARNDDHPPNAAPMDPFGDRIAHNRILGWGLATAKNYQVYLRRKTAGLRQAKARIHGLWLISAVLSVIAVGLVNLCSHLWKPAHLWLPLVAMAGVLIFIGTFTGLMIHTTYKEALRQQTELKNTATGIIRELHLKMDAFLKARKADMEKLYKACIDECEHARDDSWAEQTPAHWPLRRKRWAEMAEYINHRRRVEDIYLDTVSEFIPIGYAGLTAKAIYKAHFIRFWLRRDAIGHGIQAGGVALILSATTLSTLTATDGLPRMLLPLMVTALLALTFIYATLKTRHLEGLVRTPEGTDIMMSNLSVVTPDDDPNPTSPLPEHLRLDAIRQMRDDDRRR